MTLLFCCWLFMHNVFVFVHTDECLPFVTCGFQTDGHRAYLLKPFKVPNKRSPSPLQNSSTTADTSPDSVIVLGTRSRGVPDIYCHTLATIWRWNRDSNHAHIEVSTGCPLFPYKLGRKTVQVQAQVWMHVELSAWILLGFDSDTSGISRFV